MSEHKESAVAWLSQVGEDTAHGEAQTFAAIAQAYATLELAEQTRVSNLLRLDPSGQRLPVERLHEVRAALGLPDGDLLTAEEHVAIALLRTLNGVLRVYDSAIMGLLDEDAPPMSTEELAEVLNTARTKIVDAIKGAPNE